MKKLQFPFRSTLTAVLVALALAASAAGASRRSTLAITYGEGISTKVDLLGSNVRPGVAGDAEVSRKQGRTRVKLQLRSSRRGRASGRCPGSWRAWPAT